MGISKRGNPYIRRLLIHGARSCVIHLDRSRDRLGTWPECIEFKASSQQAYGCTG
ncbi:transposase [Brenneria goodwinii]|uniref:transposase n=1 Tax=Brenneria goodwinii TaxID=1109412 RepID=UPI0035578781